MTNRFHDVARTAGVSNTRKTSDELNPSRVGVNEARVNAEQHALQAGKFKRK